MDPLPDLRARLDALEEQPVGEHPAVLSDVHGALVAELDALAHRTAAGETAGRGGAPPGPR